MPHPLGGEPSRITKLAHRFEEASYLVPTRNAQGRHSSLTNTGEGCPAEAAKRRRRASQVSLVSYGWASQRARGRAAAQAASNCQSSVFRSRQNLTTSCTAGEAIPGCLLAQLPAFRRKSRRSVHCTTPQAWVIRSGSSTCSRVFHWRTAAPPAASVDPLPNRYSRSRSADWASGSEKYFSAKPRAMVPRGRRVKAMPSRAVHSGEHSRPSSTSRSLKRR